jgi:hypothetical protein
MAVSQSMISSAALQRFACVAVVTYAAVSVARDGRESAALQRQHASAASFSSAYTNVADALGCHANVAKIPMHSHCCTGVMACRKLKCIFRKGG